MDDLISRQAAIDALTNYGTKIIICSRESLEDVQNAIETVINAQEEAIKNLPATKQWIPCAERKPEEGISVLICTNDGIRTDGVFDGEGEIIEWEGAMSDRCFDSDEVIAWMPLPEPYEEQTNA